jgi:rsbT co-antagonist protein RsbR
MERLVEAFKTRIDEFVETSSARVGAADLPFYRSLPPAVRAGAIRKAFVAVALDLVAEKPTAFPALMQGLGLQRAAQGVSVTDMLVGMGMGFDTASQGLAVQFANDPEAIIFWEYHCGRISYAGAAALADAYVSSREQVVRAQADEILSLSTQVLPVLAGIALLPLVGLLDSDRAERITLALLSHVSRQHARVVIIDISGVPRVDGVIANHLLSAAHAVRLLGATPLLVGMSPDVARTMVDEGLALGTLTTLADLERGLRHALTLTGYTLARR